MDVKFLAEYKINNQTMALIPSHQSTYQTIVHETLQIYYVNQTYAEIMDNSRK
ncbi:MAG: competence protein ComK [Bacillus sp. (in: Bacteria)]|nr:competence protein ComK [Bacillus sp. (in: firmicutes)]